MDTFAFIGLLVNSTSNGQEDIDIAPTYYQQAPTIFFVIAGLASMLFLIVIAIALLCYSHYVNRSQRQIELRSQNTSSTNLYAENAYRSSISQWSSPETPHQTTPILFVCNPGESKPTCFAQVASLLNDHIALYENVNYINGDILYFQRSSVLTPTSTLPSMPSSRPLLLQPQVRIEHEVGEIYSTRQLLIPEENAYITFDVPVLLPPNNETISSIMIANNDLSTHDMHKANSKEVNTTMTLQSQPNSSQSIDEQSLVPSTSAINNFSTSIVESLEFRQEKIDDANELMKNPNANILPSTSYANLPQEVLQPTIQALVDSKFQPTNILNPNTSCNTSAVAQIDLTMPSNLESVEQLDSINNNSFLNSPCILSTASTSNLQPITTSSNSKPKLEEQKYESQIHGDTEMSDKSESNLLLLVEPSVNVITHSIQQNLH